MNKIENNYFKNPLTNPLHNFHSNVSSRWKNIKGVEGLDIIRRIVTVVIATLGYMGTGIVAGLGLALSPLFNHYKKPPEPIEYDNVSLTLSSNGDSFEFHQYPIMGNKRLGEVHPKALEAKACKTHEEVLKFLNSYLKRETISIDHYNNPDYHGHKGWFGRNNTRHTCDIPKMTQFVERKIIEKNSSYPEYVIGKIFDKSIDTFRSTTSGIKQIGIGSILLTYCTILTAVTILPAYVSQRANTICNGSVWGQAVGLIQILDGIRTIPKSVLVLGASAGLFALFQNRLQIT